MSGPFSQGAVFGALRRSLKKRRNSNKDEELEEKMALAKTKKKEVISKYKISKNDSGSDEVQIALLTERINGLSGHFEKNVKDHHSRYGLIKMVSRRKRLLKHLQSETPEKYQQIIARLDLRK